MKQFTFFISILACIQICNGQQNKMVVKDSACIGWKATISGDASVCRPGTIQFSSNEPGGTWSSSNISAVGTINQNGLFITANRAGTTKIIYIVTNANGCRDTASKWIRIFNAPNAGNISGDTAVCRGGTIQFSTTGSGGTWSSSNISDVGTIDQNGLFTTGSRAGTTKIRYIVTNANGCSDTASKWIRILQKPNAGTITGDSIVCRGRKIRFTTTSSGGTWSSSNISAVGTIDQNGVFTTGTTAGTTKIMYIVANANGCRDTASKWITILHNPSAGTISGDTAVCRGGTIQFSTTGSGGTWSSTNISAVGTIDQNGLFTTGSRAGTTKIRYIVTNANGCSDTASKWIRILQKPNAGTITGDSIVCLGQTASFATTSSGGTWSSSNISAVGTIDQNGIFTTGTTSGTTKIMYIVTQANGCSDTASKWISIKNCNITQKTFAFHKTKEHNNLQHQPVVRIFPNPFINRCTLIGKDNTAGTVRIFHNSGQLVQTLNYQSNKAMQLGEFLPAGIYWIEIVQPEYTQRIKAIKIK